MKARLLQVIAMVHSSGSRPAVISAMLKTIPAMAHFSARSSRKNCARSIYDATKTGNMPA
ncbi:MAG: hypothetical protein Q8Q26_15655 [Pseudorhodobacter sp.]|nr:hypothetical protein [Pseudorhodobacter sp.]